MGTARRRHSVGSHWTLALPHLILLSLLGGQLAQGHDIVLADRGRLQGDCCAIVKQDPFLVCIITLRLIEGSHAEEHSDIFVICPIHRLWRSGCRARLFGKFLA